MDTRTIGQILSNPEWLRSTLAEDRPIQQAQTWTNVPAPAPQQDYTGYQQVAPPPHPSTFIPAPPPYELPPAVQALAPARIPMRPDSGIVEVRGTIAYVARYRAEYFNPNDQPQMMALAQSVIMGETGEDPPPWFPDVQFWIQSFERIDPYANAQAEELERLHLHRAKLEQEQLARIREAELAEQLRREHLLYGEPGTFSREGTLTGLAPGGPPRGDLQGGGASTDWLGATLRELADAIGGIHQRLEAMERRGADGPAGAGAAVHPDPDRPGDPDRAGGDGADAAAARRDPAERMAAEAYVDVAAEPARDLPVDAAGDPVPEPGGGEEPEPVRARSYADRRQRKAPLTTT